MSTLPDEKAHIGARLRWAREQAGFSQGQVAKLLEVHRPTISQIENGERMVKAAEVARFADLYDVRDDWILRGDEVFGKLTEPRIELAARELSKLSAEDLDTILRLIKTLKIEKE